MEEALWKSANKLRGSVEPAEYKHVVIAEMLEPYDGILNEIKVQSLIQFSDSLTA